MHIPVLCQEVITALALPENAVVFDGTFGRGGHAKAILETLGPQACYIACDQDLTAVQHGQTLFKDDPRFHIEHHSFTQIQEILEKHQVDGLDGCFLDLGVSSPQLDEADRGFSFRRQGPLDMRMNPSVGQTAAEWVNTASEKEIGDVLKHYGEEPKGRVIARAILARRVEQPFETTTDLANLITGLIRGTPNRHAATKTFQAIRIWINQEMSVLEQVLPKAIAALKPGGRLCVISFHSLEDRIVKRLFQHLDKADHFPKDIAIRPEQIIRTAKLVGKAVKAGDQELQMNPRARSAIMRVLEKC